MEKQYCVQVSSWKNKNKAEEEAKKLRAKKENVFIMPFTNSENGKTWYRVRIGFFKTVEETERYLSKFKYE